MIDDIETAFHIEFGPEGYQGLNVLFKGMDMSSNTRLRNKSDVDSTAVIATWMRRCGLPLAILAWSAVALLLLWLAGHVIQSLLLLTIAALLAYALAPAVKLLERVMPRFLAILIVYLLVLGALSALLYLIVSTAISQFVSLSDYVRFLLTPGRSGQLTHLEQTLRSFGISQSQIASARDQVIAGIEGLAGSVVPLLTGLFGAVLDVILVAVLSIYLLAGGSRVSDWSLLLTSFSGGEQLCHRVSLHTGCGPG
jgi:predicted PurR-regulated permease PerM